MRQLLLLAVAIPALAQQMSLAYIHGPSTVFRNRGSSYVQIALTIPTPDAGYVSWTSVTLPTGVSYQPLCDDTYYRCLYNAETGKWRNWAQQSPLGFGMRLWADGTASLGTQPVTAVLTHDTLGEVTVNFNIVIEDPPAAPGAAPLMMRRGFPPYIDTWKSNMTSYGATFCDPGSGTPPWGNESHVWYYDGGMNYLNVARFTGDTATWHPCAFWILDAWKDQLLYTKSLGSFYETHGWHVFTHGLLAGWKINGNPDYQSILIGITNGEPYTLYYTGDYKIALTGENCWGGLMRESAYTLDVMLNAEKAGGVRTSFMDLYENRPKIYVAADRLLHQLDTFFRQAGQQCEFQSWIAGLAARSLIDYYEWTKDDAGGPDTRVIRTVKELMDWAWAHRDGSDAVLNNPASPGTDLCCASSGGCGVYWPLNNAFLAPAFAWYWRLTGDENYLVRGDAIFAGLRNQGISMGKHWSQIYRWTFSYYDWRTVGLIGNQTRGRGKFHGRVKIR